MIALSECCGIVCTYHHSRDHSDVCCIIIKSEVVRISHLEENGRKRDDKLGHWVKQADIIIKENVYTRGKTLIPFSSFSDAASCMAFY